MIVFERRYPVNVYNTGFNNRLSLVSLFDFFQDLAGRHASELHFGRDDLMNNGTIWVLSRITVEIKRLPALWDEVILRTWPRGTEAIFALRDFEMYDSEGAVKIAGASSSWVVVDYNTRKVQRPDRALSHLNAKFPETKALGYNAVKIPVIAEQQKTVHELHVTTADIDVNMHVNNASYIRWAANCYDMDFLGRHHPVTVDVNYLSEGLPGDRVQIFTAPDPSGEEAFIHSVVRLHDRAELSRIRITWGNEKV